MARGFEAQNIGIKFEKGYFYIKIPYALKNLVGMLSEYKWQKAKTAWKCANTPANRDAIRMLMDTQEGTITKSAKAALEVIMTVPDIIPKGHVPFERLAITFEPMEHQRRVLSRAYSTNAFAIFHKMGLGKTLSAIAIAQIWQVDIHLVIPPNSLVNNWKEQIPKLDKKHNAGKAEIYDVSDLRKGKLPNNIARGASIYILIGIESLQSGGAYKLLLDELTDYRSCGYKILATIDESTSVKTFNSERTRRMHDLADDFVDYKLLLNGTSITKGYEDHFGQFRFLGMDVIGFDSYYAFRNQYCIMGGYEEKSIIAYKNTEELLDKIAPYTDIEDKRGLAPDKLPPSISVVPLSIQQRKIYDEVKAGMVLLSGDVEMEIDEVIVEYIRLQQVCGGFFPDGLDEYGKGIDPKPIRGANPALNELVRLVGMYDREEPLVIFCKYQAEVDMIADAVAKARYKVKDRSKNPICAGRFYGGNTNAAVEMQAFKEGKIGCIIGTFSMMAKGHDLYMANTTLYYSFPFSYDLMEQSEDRTNRLSSTNEARYHVIVRENTIDEIIWQVLKDRKSLSDYINGELANRQVQGI